MATPINWFPGHMHKALENLKKTINEVDLILEVVDARAVETSSNSDLTNFRKPILKIALKKDLALIKNEKNILFCSIKEAKTKTIIINEINRLLKDKYESKIKKGLKNPTFCVMVVGLPNVGKSSLINLLGNRKNQAVGNKPGVTKSQNIIKISSNIYLYDNPGIFFKKINDNNVGYILCLISCVRKEVVILKDVLSFVYGFYIENHLDQLNNYFQFNCEELTFEEFENKISDRFKFITSNNQIDYNRMHDFLFVLFSNNKICKVNYEK